MLMSAEIKYWVNHHLCDEALCNNRLSSSELDEYVLIRSYFTNLLRLAKVTNDLKLLLPSQLLGCIEEYLGDSNIVTTVTTEQVYAFNQTHKKEICLLKQRMLLNMLED